MLLFVDSTRQVIRVYVCDVSRIQQSVYPAFGYWFSEPEVCWFPNSLPLASSCGHYFLWSSACDCVMLWSEICVCVCVQMILSFNRALRAKDQGIISEFYLCCLGDTSAILLLSLRQGFLDPYQFSSSLFVHGTPDHSTLFPCF